MAEAIGIESLTLSNGDLRFSARAAGTGELVLLLHGFPDTERSFDAQLLALAAAGYRAVAVRMRGYELTSQPGDNDYHAVRMAEDVIGWIGKLNETRAHLVGHDWGSIIAQVAAALSASHFASLSMLAVPRMRPFTRLVSSDRRQAVRSLYGVFFQIPRISNWAIRIGHFAFLEWLWRRWSPGWDAPKSMLDELKATFAEPGVIHAALSYYRQNRDRRSPAGQVSAALLRQAIRVPTLGLYGANDGCIGADIFARSMPEQDFLAGLQLHCVPDAGHFFHLERPALVNSILVEFLNANRSG